MAQLRSNHPSPRQAKLSIEEEIDLAQRAQAGDTMALRTLLSSHRGWARTYAVRQAYRLQPSGCIDLEDLFQAANIGLFRAAFKFTGRSHNGTPTKFTTMATPWMRKEIGVLFNDCGGLARIPQWMADKLPKIRTAYEKLQADEPEREPTVAELMEKSGENQEHVEYALSIFRLDSWSLDWLIDTHGEDDGWLRRVRDEAPSATPLTLAQRVRAVVDQLDDRARLVIYTFYGLSNDAVESSLEPGQTTTSAWYAGLRREEVQRIKAAALCHLQRTYYSELQDCLTAA